MVIFGTIGVTWHRRLRRRDQCLTRPFCGWRTADGGAGAVGFATRSHRYALPWPGYRADIAIEHCHGASGHRERRVRRDRSQATSGARRIHHIAPQLRSAKHIVADVVKGKECHERALTEPPIRPLNRTYVRLQETTRKLSTHRHLRRPAGALTVAPGLGSAKRAANRVRPAAQPCSAHTSHTGSLGPQTLAVVVALKDQPQSRCGETALRVVVQAQSRHIPWC